MKAYILNERVLAGYKKICLKTLKILCYTLLFSMPGFSLADLTSMDRFTPHNVKENNSDSDHVFSELTIIDNNELSNMRGGFKIGDTDINISAFIRTLIDGRISLETQLTVADNGQITNTTSTTGLTGPAVILNNGLNPTLQDVTAKGVEFDGLQGGDGIVLNDQRGFTAIINNIQKNRFLSTIINRASGRNIQHRVEIDVSIKNFRQLQLNAGIARLAHRLSRR